MADTLSAESGVVVVSLKNMALRQYTGAVDHLGLQFRMMGGLHMIKIEGGAGQAAAPAMLETAFQTLSLLASSLDHVFSLVEVLHLSETTLNSKAVALASDFLQVLTSIRELRLELIRFLEPEAVSALVSKLLRSGSLERIVFEVFPGVITSDEMMSLVAAASCSSVKPLVFSISAPLQRLCRISGLDDLITVFVRSGVANGSRSLELCRVQLMVPVVEFRALSFHGSGLATLHIDHVTVDAVQLASGLFLAARWLWSLTSLSLSYLTSGGQSDFRLHVLPALILVLNSSLPNLRLLRLSGNDLTCNVVASMMPGRMQHEPGVHLLLRALVQARCTLVFEELVLDHCGFILDDDVEELGSCAARMPVLHHLSLFGTTISSRSIRVLLVALSESVSLQHVQLSLSAHSEMRRVSSGNLSPRVQKYGNMVSRKGFRVTATSDPKLLANHRFDATVLMRNVLLNQMSSLPWKSQINTIFSLSARGLAKGGFVSFAKFTVSGAEVLTEQFSARPEVSVLTHLSFCDSFFGPADDSTNGIWILNMLSVLPALQVLRITRSGISRWPVEPNGYCYPPLREVDLRWNCLTAIPTSLLKIPSLTELDVSYNRIDPMSLIQLDGLPEFHDCSVISNGNTKLSSADEVAMKQLGTGCTLQVLDFSYHALESLMVSSLLTVFKSITKLVLTSCGLRAVPPTLVASLIELRELDLSVNRLESLPWYLLNHPNLETIESKANPLRFVPKQFQGISSVQTLKAALYPGATAGSSKVDAVRDPMTPTNLSVRRMRVVVMGDNDFDSSSLLYFLRDLHATYGKKYVPSSLVSASVVRQSYASCAPSLVAFGPQTTRFEKFDLDLLGVAVLSRGSDRLSSVALLGWIASNIPVATQLFCVACSNRRRMQLLLPLLSALPKEASVLFVINTGVIDSTTGVANQDVSSEELLSLLSLSPSMLHFAGAVYCDFGSPIASRLDSVGQQLIEVILTAAQSRADPLLCMSANQSCFVSSLELLLHSVDGPVLQSEVIDVCSKALMLNEADRDAALSWSLRTGSIVRLSESAASVAFYMPGDMLVLVSICEKLSRIARRSDREICEELLKHRSNAVVSVDELDEVLHGYFSGQWASIVRPVLANFGELCLVGEPERYAIIPWLLPEVPLLLAGANLLPEEIQAPTHVLRVSRAVSQLVRGGETSERRIFTMKGDSIVSVLVWKLVSKLSIGIALVDVWQTGALFKLSESGLGSGLLLLMEVPGGGSIYVEVFGTGVLPIVNSTEGFLDSILSARLGDDVALDVELFFSCIPCPTCHFNVKSNFYGFPASGVIRIHDQESGNLDNVLLMCSNCRESARLATLVPSLYQSRTTKGYILFSSITLDPVPLANPARMTLYIGTYLNRRVVVKKPSIQYTSSTEHRAVVQAFRTELYVMQRIEHPNIIELIGLSISPLAIVMEYADQGNLRDLLDSAAGASLTSDVRFQLAIDVASAMRYLHTRDPPIVHLDLKSPNVLLLRNERGDSRAKVADFGSSRSALEKFSEAPDCPFWLAPELMSKSGLVHIDWRVDVFSYGIVLWELMTSAFPYGSNHRFLFALADQIVCGLRPDMSLVTHSGARHLIEFCLAQDPAARPTMAAVHSMLLNLREGREGVAVSKVTAVSMRKTAPPIPRRVDQVAREERNVFQVLDVIPSAASAVGRLAVSGTMVWAASSSGEVYMWNSGVFVGDVIVRSEPCAICYVGEQKLVCACADGTLRIVDTQTLRVVFEQPIGPDPLSCILRMQAGGLLVVSKNGDSHFFNHRSLLLTHRSSRLMRDTFGAAELDDRTLLLHSRYELSAVSSLNGQVIAVRSLNTQCSTGLILGRTSLIAQSNGALTQFVFDGTQWLLREEWKITGAVVTVLAKVGAGSEFMAGFDNGAVCVLDLSSPTLQADAQIAIAAPLRCSAVRSICVGGTGIDFWTGHADGHIMYWRGRS
jgi:serine/threonine protein kinase